MFYNTNVHKKSRHSLFTVLHKTYIKARLKFKSHTHTHTHTHKEKNQKHPTHN